MANTGKANRARAARPSKTTPATSPVDPSSNPQSTRELVESLVVAFILAFLIRSFEAEAYQIPTGSMGPTLMGRHKDVSCAQCGYEYQAGASEEIDDVTEQFLPQQEIVACTCPVCRFTMSVGPDDPTHRTPSYKGDRIAVSKGPYMLGTPNRWDVAVFKYPQEAATNYIKRIVGLPNEVIYIEHGDIFTGGEGPMTICRKPPEKVQAMMQIVYDNDVDVTPLTSKGWPVRWQPDSAGWTASNEHRTFECDGTNTEFAWLHYHHIVPSYEDWQGVLNDGKLPATASTRPQLISDFCAYNTARSISDPDRAPLALALGMHWVGDLILSCELEIKSSNGEVVLELVEGGRKFDCHFDVATGEAALAIDKAPSFNPKAKTKVKGPGTYRVSLANVDDQLTLWVDDEVVSFEQSTAYPQIDNNVPNELDLRPVGIAAKGATVRVNHLQIYRDVYYIAMGGDDPTHRGGFSEYTDNQYLFPHPTFGSAFPSRQALADFMSDPAKWGAFSRRYRAQFDLGPNDYLPLGDNSPNSSDARYWGENYNLSGELLIGKALFVYWPHAWPVYPHVRIPMTDIRIPFYPNFHRMRMIH